MGMHRRGRASQASYSTCCNSIILSTTVQYCRLLYAVEGGYNRL